MQVAEVATRDVARQVGQQDGDQPCAPDDDIVPCQRTAALAGAGLAEREQPAKPRPGRAVGRVEQQAAAIVADGQAEAVMVAREALRDPHFALRAATELGVEVAWPGQYERAKPRA